MMAGLGFLTFAKAVEVSPEEGIDTISQPTSTIFNIHSSKGIGSLLLHLPPGEMVTLNFFYSADKPIKTFEELTISHISNGLDLTEGLVTSGRFLVEEGKLIIKKQNGHVKWHISFIDYFRN